MRYNTLISGIISLVMLCGCQKDVNWQDGIKSCGVAFITVKNASGSITEQYRYDYDSITHRPNFLHYDNLVTGKSKNIYPIYRNDSIYLEQGNFILTDRSNRITALRVKDEITGKAVTYYYTYNDFGELKQRLMDDGVSEIIKTDFNYENGALVTYKQDYPGFPQAISAVVQYETTPAFNGYYEVSLVDIFPELIRYLPTFKMGRSSGYPIKQVVKSITLTNTNPVTTTSAYSNYQVSAEGWPEAFESANMVGGVTKSKATYKIGYTCY